MAAYESQHHLNPEHSRTTNLATDRWATMYLSEAHPPKKIQTSSTTPKPSSPTKREIYRVGSVAIWQPIGCPILFESGMSIDADGAPNAYHPDELGLDWLKNAGYEKNSNKKPWGIIVDRKMNPVLQGAKDPFPGFCVSPTSLYDINNPNQNDPKRYVDASSIPYIALPKSMWKSLSINLGDFAFILNTVTA